MSALSVRVASWREDQEALKSVRHKVFVMEQRIDAHEEFDEVDFVCQHILALDPAGQPVATGRIDSRGKIGRMAVLPEWRLRGVGRLVLRMAIELARSRGIERVYLHAQLSALPFYARNGFEAYGENFSEAGIEHRAMELKL